MADVVYNEWDSFAAAWMRRLIEAGALPDGQIDERSISDLTGADVAPTSHFFAGIGGWAHALKIAGWPPVRPVWTASLPCQPFSVAGQGRGTDDERHLWPVFRDLVAECRPPTIFGEQVASRAGRAWLAGVRADLEALGYAVGAADLCAAGEGAPHIRQRLYWGAIRVEDANDGESQQPPRAGTRPDQTNGAGARSEPDGPSATGRLDDAAGARRNAKGAGAEGSPRDEARLRRSECGCGSCRLANGDSWQRFGEPGGARRVTDWQASGRVQGDSQSEPSGEAGALANGDSAGPFPWHAAPSPPRHRNTFDAGHWGGADWIECLDGKWRRIPAEPWLFPLANGFSNRVGALRGAGNAIVPQVAAQFVTAFMETEHGM